jgi:hypothetical protein
LNFRLAKNTIAYLNIRDYKKGIYNPKNPYKLSGSYWLHLIIVLAFITSTYSITNISLAKAFDLSALIIIVATINILNLKAYFIQKEREIISKIIVLDSVFLLTAAIILFLN